jgi:hypothetical protein
LQLKAKRQKQQQEQEKSRQHQAVQQVARPKPRPLPISLSLSFSCQCVYAFACHMLVPLVSRFHVMLCGLQTPTTWKHSLKIHLARASTLSIEKYFPSICLYDSVFWLTFAVASVGVVCFLFTGCFDLAAPSQKELVSEGAR